MMDSNIVYEEFLAEADELLDRISLVLSTSDPNTVSMETINQIYRDIHTIKGSAYLFGFRAIGLTGHAIEAGIDPLRNGLFKLSNTMITLFLNGTDAIKSQLKSIASTGSEDLTDRSYERYVIKIISLLIHRCGADFNLSNDASFQMKLKPHDLTSRNAEPELQTQDTANVDQIASESYENTNKLQKPVNANNETYSPTPKNEKNAPETVRVQVELLDSLMNLVGELVLIRNQVVQHTSDAADANFQNLSQRLSIVTTEIQNEVMKTRMQPIGNVLTKFQRVVREMSNELGKQVNVTLIGVETELDKTLIEAVKDPLTHIVRNAVDHGIETPEERIAKNKSPQGEMKIRAFHEGGQVIVEVHDDGRGISSENIARKAVDKGLISQEQAAKLSTRDLINLAFEPGITTATKISNMSGRGVGMDVVRNNIEQIGGIVDITSSPDFGTIVRLKIPLTLAIVPALIVKAGIEKFAIPQVKLVELVRVDENAKNKIRYLQGKPVFQLRDDLLPLINLNEVLRIKDEDRVNSNSGDTNIVVLNMDDRCFGLIVDSIEDSIDIVVKPLSKFLSSMDIYAGATVLGDGSVSLTLDIAGLAKYTEMDRDTSQSANTKINRLNADQTSVDAIEYLVVDVGVPGKYAIPLCQVNRLEEFEQKSIELSGSQQVVQYRNTILPIISIPEFLNLPNGRVSPGEDGKIPTIVVGKSERLFGLQVNQILDVLSTTSTIDVSMRDRSGIIGSMLHERDVYVVLDTLEIISNLQNGGIKDETLGTSSPKTNTNSDRSAAILLVEDNNFYRKHVTQILETAGFIVDTAVNGRLGLEQLKDNPNKYIAVVSDIEMPEMDGFQLVEQIRQTEDIKDIPTIALTTRFRPQDLEKGRKCGFTRYLEKLQPDQLLAAIQQIGTERKAA